LVHEDTSAPEPRFVLAHDLVGQTLRDRLSSTRTIRLHARIAAALQARTLNDPQDLVAVAHHLTLAAPAVGPMAAIPYLLQTSEDALSRYAVDLAVEALETALTLAIDIEELDVRAATEGQVRGRLALATTTSFATPPVWVEGQEPVLSPPLDAESAAAWSASIVMTASTGHFEWARRLALEALEHDLPPAGELVVRHAVGWTAMIYGDLATARTEYDRLHTLVVDEGVRIPAPVDSHVESTLMHLALLAHAAGNDDAADEHLATAEELSSGEPGAVVHLHFYHCLVDAMRGHADSVAAHAAACLAGAEKVDYSVFQLQARVHLAWSAAVRGDEAALDGLDAAIDAYQATGLQIYVPTYRLLLADAALAHGRIDVAARAVAEAEAVTGRTGEVCISPRLSAIRDAATPRH
jgi:hypothetical protein